MMYGTLADTTLCSSHGARARSVFGMFLDVFYSGGKRGTVFAWPPGALRESLRWQRLHHVRSSSFHSSARAEAAAAISQHVSGSSLPVRAV